jgi:hypothetical protein
MKLWPFSRTKKEIPGVQVRGFREIASVGGGINGDWPVSQIGDDADMWQNAWALTSRVRDLFRSNPLYQTYRETLWANVYGSEGIMLRSRVKEQEDRVIYTPEEKAAIRAYDARQDRVRSHFAKRDGREFTPTSRPWQGTNGSSRAQVKVGDPDIFARALIEKKWQEWQRAEFCDVRGTRNYKTLRQLRLIAAVRDGDFFIRLIRDPKVNKFGFSLQLINAEWCDRFANCTLRNGNVVRMGIEYEFGSWGLGSMEDFTTACQPAKSCTTRARLRPTAPARLLGWLPRFRKPGSSISMSLPRLWQHGSKRRKRDGFTATCSPKAEARPSLLIRKRVCRRSRWGRATSARCRGA